MTIETLTRADIAALELALDLARKNPAERRRIDQRLARGEDRMAVAQWAAVDMQSERLHLPPWLVPPCSIRDIEAAINNQDQRLGYRSAAQLLQRMLDAGVSKYHPDPVRACEAAEAEQRATALEQVGRSGLPG